ncbi:MAG: tyrosine-type recombinase/integrase [Candidatus Kapaibacterium sp.]
MAKSRTRNRWKHPDRKFCYCFKRPESPFIYTSVFSKREVTDLVWKEANKNDAMAILEKRISEYMNPNETEEKTLNDLFIQYANVYYSNYTKVQQSRYNKAIEYLITKNLLCSDINAIRNEVLNNLTDLNKKYSEPYVYKILGSLKKIFDFGIEEEYLTRNPIKKAMFPIGGKRARQIFFSKEEIDKLLPYCREKRGDEFGDLVELISIIGPRINEVILGEVKDVDLENKQMTIRDFKRANKNFGETFTPRYIDIEIFDNYTSLYELLERIISRENGKYYFRWQSYANLERWLREDMKALKMYEPTKNFHAIRKYAINEFILKGFPVSLGSHFFGHNEAVMKKHYLEVMGPKKFKEFIQNSMKNVHTLPNEYPVEK